MTAEAANAANAAKAAATEELVAMASPYPEFDILDAGAKMNGADGTENLLTMAASVGYQEIVDLALAYGADPHEQDRIGRSYHDVWQTKQTR